jgi:hypothetical protein
MTNIKLEAMEKKIEDILRHTDLKEWQIENITKELLDLYNVSKLLPTDKEVCDEANKQGCPYSESTDRMDGLEQGFEHGANWVIEQIKNVC